jgi:hypothetical protein
MNYWMFASAVRAMSVQIVFAFANDFQSFSQLARSDALAQRPLLSVIASGGVA